MHLELISATWAPFLDPFNQGDGSLALCRTSARSVANGKHSHSWEESQETAEDWSKELCGGQARGFQAWSLDSRTGKRRE